MEDESIEKKTNNNNVRSGFDSKLEGARENIRVPPEVILNHKTQLDAALRVARLMTGQIRKSVIPAAMATGKAMLQIRDTYVAGVKAIRKCMKAGYVPDEFIVGRLNEGQTPSLMEAWLYVRNQLSMIDGDPAREFVSLIDQCKPLFETEFVTGILRVLYPEIERLARTYIYKGATQDGLATLTGARAHIDEVYGNLSPGEVMEVIAASTLLTPTHLSLLEYVYYNKKTRDKHPSRSRVIYKIIPSRNEVVHGAGKVYSVAHAINMLLLARTFCVMCCVSYARIGHIERISSQGAESTRPERRRHSSIIHELIKHKSL